ncbi:hypothetical protein GB928_008525, partial [Shinella curvata]
LDQQASGLDELSLTQNRQNARHITGLEASFDFLKRSQLARFFRLLDSLVQFSPRFMPLWNLLRSPRK